MHFEFAFLQLQLRLLRTDQWTESILVLPNMQSFVSPLRLLTYCFTIDETHVIAVYVDSCGILLFVIWRVFGDHFEFLNQYEARTLKIGNISISKATFKLEPLDQNRLVLFHRIQGINWMVMLHFPSNFLSQHLAVSSIDISEVKNIVDLHSVTTSSKDFLVIRSFSKCLLLQLYAKNEGGIGTEVLWTEVIKIGSFFCVFSCRGIIN